MSANYILNTNNQARDRLSLQHHLYARSSIKLVKDGGVSTGMTGLEIGCGSGEMTIELAKLVGVQGSLLAIDLSQDQLNHVQYMTRNYKNIRFKQWDVNYLSDLGEQFDFIYCRMVLHHVKDAYSAILQMKNCLKPGGIIICEEPSIFDSTFCSPPSKTYEQFTQWIRTCFTLNQCDFEIAHRLEQECASANFKVKQHTLFQPLLRTAKEKQIYSMALQDVTPQLIHLNIATQDEIDALSQDLLSLANSENTMTWIRMHQVIAELQS
ncbi:bifunctional 2-polyprenyl-6-hydroxyphenol methylase/3-demethylubiquinol 3-O-methyltransferase UbiG [uncultured Legionella sp.]|uniref:class I SAM-dependent methyltransferase n=1 Tax=uncultured Legionella sp. TaxID=210934 RepID=UPI0026039F0C|nr:class I SAM-dependent methyltransferase [uncultured Legionella sp.]